MSLSFNVLKLRDFRHLLFTRVFALMALQAQAVIVGWQVYSITKDPLMLGLTGLTEAVPAIVCALFAGYVVDISRPHFIYFACLGTLVLNTLMLYLIAGGHVAAPGGNILFWIFLGIFISGLARSFIMPASFSLLSQIVPRAQIPAASAWLNSGFQTAAISGPAIAGIIYGGYGVTIAWLLPMIFMSLAFIMITGMSAVPKSYRSGAKQEPAAKSIKAGWHFILTNPVLLSVMALDMFAVLFGGVVAILPAYADEVLHVGSEGLGILRASPAMGAIFMALILAMYPIKVVRGKTLLVVVSGFGLCMIGFGMSDLFWVSVILLALSGAFDSVSMVIRATMMQLLTPDAMRGRVSSVNSMFIISSNEIGAFRAGFAAKFLGLVPSIIIGGIATLGVVAATLWLSPKLRKAEIRADN